MMFGRRPMRDSAGRPRHGATVMSKQTHQQASLQTTGALGWQVGIGGSRETQRIQVCSNTCVLSGVNIEACVAQTRDSSSSSRAGVEWA
jgi:hypothetical protein